MNTHKQIHMQTQETEKQLIGDFLVYELSYWTIQNICDWIY